MAKQWKSTVDGFKNKNKSRSWKTSRKRSYKSSSHKRSSSKKKTEKWTSDDTVGLLVIIGLIVFGSIFGEILPFIIIVAIIGVIVWFIYKSMNTEHEVIVSEHKIQEITRIAEIIVESQNLVNTSNNVETVKSRLDVLLNMIDNAMEYKEYELQAAGYTKVYLQEQKDFIRDKYDIVINQAIERAFEKEKQEALLLKTDNGQKKRMLRFFENIKSINWLSSSNVQFIEELEELNNMK